MAFNEKSLMQQIAGVNWKTTIAGIGVLVALVSKILLELRTKDFSSLITSVNELVPDISAVLIAIGLLSAKDNNTTGAGDSAVKKD